LQWQYTKACAENQTIAHIKGTDLSEKFLMCPEEREENKKP
jgi:hypothetical protein